HHHETKIYTADCCSECVPGPGKSRLAAPGARLGPCLYWAAAAGASRRRSTASGSCLSRSCRCGNRVLWILRVPVWVLATPLSLRLLRAPSCILATSPLPSRLAPLVITRGRGLERDRLLHICPTGELEKDVFEAADVALYQLPELFFGP